MTSQSGAQRTACYRSEVRQRIEVLARLRHDLTSFTVVLRDLSPGGARVEGIAGLAEDQPVALSLPGRGPALAFVAWTDAWSAGLEFADPIPSAEFQAIVSTYGVQTDWIDRTLRTAA